MKKIIDIFVSRWINFDTNLLKIKLIGCNSTKFFNETLFLTQKNVNKINIKQYSSAYYSIWNEFVAKAKNATFLFHRDFMEYHQDRFEDYSLLVFDEKDALVAVLPANRVEDKVYSHQGLTYGGLVLSHKTKTHEVFSYLETIISFLQNNAFTKLVVKPIPVFYNKTFSSEFDYYLFKIKSNLIRKDMNLAFKLGEDYLISKSKLKKYRNSLSSGISMKEEANFESFWTQVLIPRLEEKHNAKPVHTLDEISKLAIKFPNNIKQFNAYLDDQIVAGITIFETNDVVKSQYGATTTKGESCRALDFLFLTLMEKYRLAGKSYFDMGIVTDLSHTDGYNQGLLNQKEELGCVVFEQNHYEINLQQHD